jgi:hypothetical protein
MMWPSEQDNLKQRSTAGGLRATSSPRPQVMRHAKLFVNLLQVTTSSLISLLENLKKIAILVSSDALRTSATHVSFPGSYSVSYKLLQEQI